MLALASRRKAGEASPFSVAEPAVLPTLFGEGRGLYRTRPATFVFSFPLHLLGVALLLSFGSYVATHRQKIQRQAVAIVADISPYVLPPSATRAGGGGGGGDRDKLPASKGSLPKLSREQISPPAGGCPQR